MSKRRRKSPGLFLKQSRTNWYGKWADLRQRISAWQEINCARCRSTSCPFHALFNCAAVRIVEPMTEEEDFSSHDDGGPR
jgi:hypothetical protein